MATMRKLLPLALVASVLAASGASAQEIGSCCLQSTSRLDALMNPTKGSDEKFFSGSAGVPNVMFLLGNNVTMQDYPVSLPTGGNAGADGGTGGCTDSTLVTAMSWFDLSADAGADPIDPDPDWIGSDTPFFQPEEAYVSLPNRMAFEGTNTPWSLANSFRDTSGDTNAQTACDKYSFDAASGCAACLASKGWFRGINGGNERWVLSGRVLNVRPPKFVISRKVVKDTLTGIGDIRMGVAVFGPDTGWYDEPVLIHPVKPNCNLAGPGDFATNRNDIQSKINQLTFTNPERSIGEALFGLGAYFSSQRADNKWSNWFTNPLSPAAPSNYPGSSGWDDGSDMWTRGMNIESGGQQLSVCWACQSTAVIVLSDGAPQADNSVPVSKMLNILSSNGVKHNDGTAITFNPNNDGTCPNTQTPGGVNYCDLFGSDKCFCDVAGGAPQGPDVTNRNFMDDVAFFLSHTDLRDDYTGKQVVRTYTIGYGSNDPMLQSIALAGDGLFFSANTAAQLSNAIKAAVEDINSRNTSFSSAAVSSVQSAGGTLTAVLPRFMPRLNQLWVGSLYRFEQFNEFIENVNKNPADVLADGGTDNDKEDIFITDSTGAVVVEDATGGFIRKTTGASATPYWEASDKLITLGHAGRSIYTVRDDSPAGGDGAFTSADTRIAFSTANAAALGPYLGIKGTSFCPVLAGSAGTMFTKFGRTPAQMGTLFSLPVSTQAELDTLCVTALIAFVRGQDVGDEDTDGIRTETRTTVLGDIFHSSPVVVDPPVDKFLCDIGLHNQCVRTLYTKGSNFTAVETGLSITDACSTTTGKDAYDVYQNNNRKRDKLILVGANDGMVHAFHDGDSTEVCTGSVNKITYPSSASTGVELWAFIPPDMLPRLQELVSGHAYFVDGDIMVRDIWEDADADGLKEAGEYHTMAIIADGRGGTHYTALELTWSGDDVTAPNLRWIYPQPCSPEASTFGKTLYSLSPKPPPIGPVLLEASAAFATPGAPSTSVARYTCTDGTAAGSSPCMTSERWVTVLSGGWSPSLERGRGIYMVDVWNGKINGRGDNLLWKMEFNQSASGEMNAGLKGMTNSIVAPVALVDYGKNDDARLDGYFDTAVVGDTAGKLWLARFFRPGHLNTTTKLIDNWSGGRVFEMDRDGINTSTDDMECSGGSENGQSCNNNSDCPGGTCVAVASAGGTKSVKNDWPFHYITSVGIQPDNNAMRIFTGTGNRYALLEPNAGTCRFDNPLACAKMNCSEVKTVYKIKKGGATEGLASWPGVDIGKMETHWKGQNYEHSKLESSSANLDYCGSNGATVVTAEFTDRKVETCNPPSGPNINPGNLGKYKAICGKDASGNFTCRRTDTATLNTTDLMTNGTSGTMATLGNNRFYGVWAYGGNDLPDGGTRKFLEDQTSTGTGYRTAAQFDTARLTDRTVAIPDGGSLVNVTATTCTTPTTCSGSVGTDRGHGWFYEYPAIDHRTVSGSALLASCVLWNSIIPTGVASATCGTPGVATGRFHQADFITGEPNCAAGFKDPSGAPVRWMERALLAPPPEPMSAIQVSKTGQLRYSAMLVEPGKEQATELNVSTGQDVLQSVYEIPVSRSLHNCRHVAGGSGNCVEAPP